MEVLRGQYSIDTAYEESREGISQLSHLTPIYGKSTAQQKGVTLVHLF